MVSTLSRSHDFEVMRHPHTVEISLLLYNIRNGVWCFGIPSWLFGITDRTVASFSDGYVSILEVLQLFTASFFFISWLYLKPENSLDSDEVSLQDENSELSLSQQDSELYLSAAQARMFELQNYHLISQEYILPFPYLCQIYHLLNLKHLETVHNFSLNNLRIIKVSYSQPTAIGGAIKFQTVLDSPFNLLRIWRQPIVEVGLILHTPYTVELNIPVYNNKRIIVIFSAIPIKNNDHRFLVNIYSDLEWPKPLLQTVLHFASCLTLYEDLPYLRKLAARNIQRLFTSNKASQHETMWLYNRFVELYGSETKNLAPTNSDNLEKE